MTYRVNMTVSLLAEIKIIQMIVRMEIKYNTLNLWCTAVVRYMDFRRTVDSRYAVLNML